MFCANLFSKNAPERLPKQSLLGSNKGIGMERYER